MRWIIGGALLCSVLLAAGYSVAQPPGGGRGKGGDKGGKGGPGGGRSSSVEDMVNRMMAFDKNKDGYLTKEKMGDSRLAPLLDKADANKDGKVTKDELTAFFTKENAKLGNNQGGPGGEKGGFDKGPGGRGGQKGGPGGQGKQKGPGGFSKGPGGPDGDQKGPPPGGDQKGPPPGND